MAIISGISRRGESVSITIEHTTAELSKAVDCVLRGEILPYIGLHMGQQRTLTMDDFLAIVKFALPERYHELERELERTAR